MCFVGTRSKLVFSGIGEYLLSSIWILVIKYLYTCYQVLVCFVGSRSKLGQSRFLRSLVVVFTTLSCIVSLHVGDVCLQVNDVFRFVPRRYRRHRCPPVNRDCFVTWLLKAWLEGPFLLLSFLVLPAFLRLFFSANKVILKSVHVKHFNNRWQCIIQEIATTLVLSFP